MIQSGSAKLSKKVPIERVAVLTGTTKRKLVRTFIITAVLLNLMVLVVAYNQASRNDQEVSSILASWYGEATIYIALFPAAFFITTIVSRASVMIPLKQEVDIKRLSQLLEKEGFGKVSGTGNTITVIPSTISRLTNNNRKFNVEILKEKVMINGPLLFNVRLSRWLELKLDQISKARVNEKN